MKAEFYYMKSKSAVMQTNCLLLIVVAVLSSQGQVLADDDSDCMFTKSLTAKPEFKELAFSVSHKIPRNFCVYWKIVTPKSKVVEVQVPAVHSFMDVTCKEGYLKLVDDDSEVIADVKKGSQNSNFLTTGCELMIYFQPSDCLKDFKLNYRSVSRLGLTGSSKYSNDDSDEKDSDDNGEDDDDDNEGIGSKAGRIVGAVIGSVLAVLLIILIFFLVRICVKRRRADNTASRDDHFAVHFCSKPSGYTQAATSTPTSSRAVSNIYDSQPGVSSKKPTLDGGADAGGYPQNKADPSAFSSVSPPAPPPYSGPATNLPAEASHHREESPPSYSDAVQGK